MTPAEHQAYLDQLRTNLAADPDVLGLVTLGSSSGLPPLPDDFSDHDFFVVVRSGTEDRFRGDLTWLPRAGDIALSFRETAHGLKVLYRDGHLVEFAVFDPEALALARVNRYAVPLDRADVGPRLARVREASQARAPVDARWHAGQLLTNLVVGAGRHARGERLSGHHLVRGSAAHHLLMLVREGLPAVASAELDDLDPWRRLERALPEVAAEVLAALDRPVPAAARGLLELARRLRPELFEAPVVEVVERALAAAERHRP